MNSVLLWAVLTPFIGAGLAPFLGRWLGAKAGYLLALCFVPALSLLRWSSETASENPPTYSLDWVTELRLTLAFRADGFSLLFTLIVAGIGCLVFCYAAAYLGSKERHGRFYSHLLMFAGAMLGLVLTDNLIALFAFWEMTSISSFLLIGFWNTRRASQDGALKALVITALGGLALLAAVILVIVATGSVNLSGLDLDALQTSPLFSPAVILFLLAAVTKSAQVPFHLWLPTAMEAPTPVSAYLHSATMVKAGVILIAKLGYVIEGSGLDTLIMYIGLITLFWGSYLAMRQDDLKALLAYSTVSQLGLLMSLYGAGHPFAATAHLVNHAAFKAVLFMVVGIIDHETKSRDLTHLSGLRHKLPITFALAIPAVLSMASLPIFGGFISKELFYEAMLYEGLSSIMIAGAGSIMTFAYSLRFLTVFLGPYRADNPEVHEAKPLFWLPIVPLTVLVIAFGIWPLDGQVGIKSPTLATWFTNLAASSLGYTAKPLYLWHGINTALILSLITWVLGLGLHIIQPHFLKLQRSLTPNWNVNTLYYLGLRRLEGVSHWCVRYMQEATFATHLRLIFSFLLAIGASVGWRYIPKDLSPIPLEIWITGMIIVCSTLGVLSATSRVSAVLYTGLSGIATVLLFVLMSAPDLALTQLLIETVSIILFLSVFNFLPKLTPYVRSQGLRSTDGLIALGVAATIFTALSAVQQPIAQRIQDFYLENSKTLGGGYNVVNVILVDFRGYDTMGEIVVLAVVAISVSALLKRKAKIDKDK
jgi:multicomponent K+:H+ antiporter subunit A/multicomponent Na+:H+ antiporter subunit A